VPRYFALGKLNVVSPFILVGEKEPFINDDKSRLVSAFIVELEKIVPEIRNLGMLTDVKLGYEVGDAPRILLPTYIRFGAENDVIDVGNVGRKAP
jgi:hypothetical protein